MTKITLEALERLAADPDADLSGYFRLDEEGSDAFAPRIVVDPDKVDVPDHGDDRRGPLLVPGANWFARRQRLARFHRKLAEPGYDGPVIVSEGDSWFQYPFQLEDTIDHLMREHAILSLGAAGDTLSNMVKQQEYLRGLGESRGTILLVSAGGNDLLGGGDIEGHLDAFDPALKPADYLLPSFGALVDRALGQYERLFRDVSGAFPWVRVICHGYDYPVPRDGGRWLGRPMARRGIEKDDLRRAIAVEMMDVFNRGLYRVARRLGHVTYVDCRGAVGEARWHDELHPTNDGYASVAALIAAEIGHVGQRRAAPLVVSREPRGRSLHLGLNAIDPAEWHSDGALMGCENDARAMADLAAEQGFVGRTLLTRHATREAVVAEVREAASVLREGDMFLWTMSCHGMQVTDWDRDEVDDGDLPMDEALMLFDWPLTDDAIYDLWADFAPGVRILMVPDTCHAGDMLKNPPFSQEFLNAKAQGITLPMELAAPRVRQLPDHGQAMIRREKQAIFREQTRHVPREGRRPVNASVLSLTACRQDQFALDGDVHGAFTEALLSVWDRGRFRGGHASFHDAITRRIGRSNQVPQLKITGAPDPTFLAQTPFTLRTNPRVTVAAGVPPAASAREDVSALLVEEAEEHDPPVGAESGPRSRGDGFDADAFKTHMLGLGLRHFEPSEFLVMGGGHANPNHLGHGLNTPPPRELWPNVDDVARVADELRERLGSPVRITNAYRSPAYNASLKGAATNSQHMRFRALDLEAPNASSAACARILREMRREGLFSGGIGTYDSFVHVDTRGWPADWDGRRRRRSRGGRRAAIDGLVLARTRSRPPEAHSVFAGEVPASDADVLAAQEALGTAVSGPALVSFVEGLSPARKEDVLLSTLFAERAAAAQADPVAERDAWFRAYVDTLGLLGWSTEGSPSLERREARSYLEFEAAVLDVLGSVATGGQLGMLEAALGALKGLKTDKGPLRLFDFASSSLAGGHFQVGAAQATGEVVSMALGAFHYEWTDERRHVLAAFFGDARMSYWIGARRMALSPGLYDEIRDLVRKRLRYQRRTLLADLQLELAHPDPVGA